MICCVTLFIMSVASANLANYDYSYDPNGTICEDHCSILNQTGVLLIFMRQTFCLTSFQVVLKKLSDSLSGDHLVLTRGRTSQFFLV